MIPTFPRLYPGQTPSAEDWNRLVEHLTTTHGTAGGVMGGSLSLSRSGGGFLVEDGRPAGHWAKITARGTGNNYSHTYAVPNGDGTFTDLAASSEAPYGTTTVVPAHEVNGRVDFDSSLPLYKYVWPDTGSEATPGYLFDAGPASGAAVSAWKEPVRVATTANGTLATSFENGDVIDGVTLATDDRILVKNQTTGSENGIRVVGASGTPARAADCDSAAEFYGATVHVLEGDVNANTVWQCVTNPTITVGTTATVWELTSQPASKETVYTNNTTVGTSYTDTGWDLVVPAAGTYDVYCQGWIQGTANIDGSGGMFAGMRWYNETAAAAVTATERALLYVPEGASHTSVFLTKHRITLTAPATLRVEVMRQNSGGSASLLGDTGFGTANKAGAVSYVRVAP